MFLHGYFQFQNGGIDTSNKHIDGKLPFVLQAIISCFGQVQVTSGGVQLFFSWTIRNPNRALHDYSYDVNDTTAGGISVEIPWNDVNTNNTHRIRKRSTTSQTASLYGSTVGTQHQQNEFQLTVLSSVSSTSVTTPVVTTSTQSMRRSAGHLTTGSLLTSFLTLLVAFCLPSLAGL